MPDIFGREPHDYQVVRALQETNQWERYQAANAGNAETRADALPGHSFQALGAGVPREFQRATQDQQAIGYLTNNMLAIQTMADEILYTAYRLPRFISLNTNIPEGATSYGVRVRDRVGRAQRISGPGFEAPSALASESLATQEIFWYGLDAEWSIDELRGAMMAGVPLDTEAVDAAVTGTLEKMEEVGLLGEENYRGLLTLNAASDGVQVTSAPDTFENMTAVEIRNLINGEISRVIEESRETIGRNISDGMTVYLPGLQYDLLTTRYIGDNAERPLMRSIMEDNPWTALTGGNAVSIERVLELDSSRLSAVPGSGLTQDRMVVTLRHPRVCEMGVSISPRVLRIQDKGRVVCAQIEAKFSPLFVKRGSVIRMTDGI